MHRRSRELQTVGPGIAGARLHVRASLAIAALALTLAAGGVGAQPADCDDWRDCRAQALEAESAGDVERFHDLAWRAMQRRGELDPEVMIVLARAQARSGRPHDSLVMLRRITELGVAPLEARTSDAFERTRRLAGWSEVEARIDRLAPAGDAPSSAGTTAPSSDEPVMTEIERSRPGDSPAAVVAPDPPAVIARSAAPAKPAVPDVTPEEAVRFRAPDLVPAGLAYDVVSGRFLLGNRLERTVVTISERLQAATDLVRSASAGFHDVLAIAIDPRRGDLWVASAGRASGSDAPEAALHKLQLVSGRPLDTIPLDTGDRAPRFSALAVDPGGAVFALDGAESRLWRLSPGGRQLKLVAQPELTAMRAMALDPSSRRAYIAHADGLSRVSLANGTVLTVGGPDDAGLAAIESLAWYKGSLVAVEHRADVPRRLLRLRLDRAGTKILEVEALDPDVTTCRGPGIVTVSGDDVYYLTGDRGERAAEDCAIVVQRVTLR